MSRWSSCPFCSQQVLSEQLQRHANSHFEDEDGNEQDIAFASTLHNNNKGEVEVEVEAESDFVATRSSLSGDGLIPLLKNCLECDDGTSFLSSYVDHFQTQEFVDVGWGCGWRNIQMLASHLLVKSQQARDVLFHGSGLVPDIPSLQACLQAAWDKGFDVPGSIDFHGSIYGKHTWIGTTECAALFRSFGLRARIVDFCHGSSSNNTNNQVIGPMDKFLNRPLAAAAAGSSNNNKDKCMVKKVGQQLLADWVWSYFSHNVTLTKSKVVVTDKPPLYFQHDGHSRTIVGIQLKSLPKGGMQQYNLLILDPSHKTQVLKTCLSKRVGWQRFIKRGVHTLNKSEYQLCYVDPGIATGAEMEKLKILDSTRFEF